MKLVADPIYVPDNADWQTIEDAKTRASWHQVKSRDELMSETDLSGKCGSCKHFCSRKYKWTKVVGACDIRGINDSRQRSTPGCKSYERSDYVK